MVRARSILRAAATAAGLVLTYAALAFWLPGGELAEDPEGDAAPTGQAAGAIRAGQCADREHSADGSCGLAPKAMLSRFRAAIESKGAIHSTYEAGGSRAVVGQVNLGLEADAFERLEGIARSHGLEVSRRLPRLGLGLLTLPAGADARQVAVALAAEPGVRFAEPNYVARVALMPNDSFLPIMPQRQAGLESAWDVTTGDANVVVAVLDTGLDTTHPDLTNRALPGYDFVNQTATMSDDNGHGTAMAGIIAAEGQNREGVAGVAFNCRILPVKVADAMGQASVADVAAGIDFAIQGGVRVINLSLGTPLRSQALQDAVNRALAAGIVVVASAGNDPIHREMLPAGYDGVISATPLSDKGELGYDAVVASGVDVGAPGEDLITTLPGAVYGFVSGSSAAAAFSSGVAALCFSADPTLTGAQVSEILRQSQQAIPALKGLERVYTFGSLDASIAVRRADPTLVDVAVSQVRLYPKKPQPGQPATAVIELSNQGSVSITGQVIRVARVRNGQRIEIGFQVVDLALGERREVVFPFTAPAAGSYLLRATASTRPGETEVFDNERTIGFDCDVLPEAELRIVSRTISEPNAALGTITATVVLENLGTQDAVNVIVDAEVTAAGSRLSRVPAGAAGAPAPTGAGRLARQIVASVPVGGQGTAQFVYTIPTPAPTGILRLRVSAQPLAGEAIVYDNTAYLDFRIGSNTGLRGLYQQSNKVDVNPDAPWRVDPARPYVPVQVFVPSKGGTSSSTRLTLERTTVDVADTPTGPRTAVYADTFGAPPSVSAPGMVLVDELGAAQASLDMFGDRIVDQNGHHQILRIPRGALGVATNPAAPTDKYLDTKVEWAQERVLLWAFTRTRSGSHRVVLRVRFSSAALPSLPGDNHYHDVHHHTIAEWYFGSPLDIFAPRKAYGGPLQMVVESAYAMGIIDQPSVQSARGRIITTDHNSFNNRTIPDPDGPSHRPPFGPQSPSQKPGLSQLEAYRAIFGDTAGEEIAFDQDVPMPTLPLVNNLLNMLPGIPIGAHMLLYNAEHVEGPWHGGGWLRGPGNPNISVDLHGLLNDVAKNRQPNQSRAFSYASHPFGGQGWNDSNVDRAFGLDPQYRTRDAVHDGSNKFVLKGVEYFNGRGTRKMPTSAIDFEDLNPWANSDFQAGEAGWDKKLWEGQTRWHTMLADVLEYSFTSDPETRFIRKIYQAGGSDAHGDFNFSTGRAATPLNLQMTFNVGDEAWYGVRTYCLGAGKAGATAEDRWLSAYADGNSVTSDGPLVGFSLDANGQFDSANLSWHDQTSRYEDADGRIGGDGSLDGGYTALVERGADSPVFRYRYSSTDEWGAVASVLLYKTEAGNPNPVRSRPSGILGLLPYDQILGVNEMVLGGADTDLDQPLDPASEGPVNKITAFAMGAFTGGNPDVIDLGTDNYRCYTNPVFCVPFDAAVSVGAVDPVTGTIPAGALEVRFTFDVSMDPAAYAVEVKALDANGDSTGRGAAALTEMLPLAGSGWSDRPGVKNSVLTLVNRDAISLGGANYPASGRVSFVIYFADPPRDAVGNALNPIAATFSEAANGVGGGSTTAPVGSTTAPSTAASTAPIPASGGGSSSGCALSGGGVDAPWLALLSLLAVLGAARCAASRSPERYGPTHGQ